MKCIAILLHTRENSEYWFITWTSQLERLWSRNTSPSGWRFDVNFWVMDSWIIFDLHIWDTGSSARIICSLNVSWFFNLYIEFSMQCWTWSLNGSLKGSILNPRKNDKEPYKCHVHYYTIVRNLSEKITPKSLGLEMEYFIHIKEIPTVERNWKRIDLGVRVSYARYSAVFFSWAQIATPRRSFV